MEIFIDILLFLLTMLLVSLWILCIFEDFDIISIFGHIEKDVCYSNPFDVKAYLDRIDRESLAIAKETEMHNQENTTIILWLCLDGLRLNADGTTTWIRRDENNIIKKYSISKCLHCGNAIGRNLDGTIIKDDPDLCSTRCTSQKKFDSEQQQIYNFKRTEMLQALEEENRKLWLKASQLEQREHIIRQLQTNIRLYKCIYQ